jgi:hypothetical protein
MLDEKYQHQPHARRPRLRETRGCAYVASPRKRAELDAARSAQNLFKSLLGPILWHLDGGPGTAVVKASATALRALNGSTGGNGRVGGRMASGTHIRIWSCSSVAYSG